MNETPVNGVKAGATEGTEAVSEEAHDEESLVDDTLAGEVLTDEVEEGENVDSPPDVEKLRRIRLRGFLRELVMEEGRMEAAGLLGVAYRTLVKAEESGEITGRVGDALERLLGTGDDPEVGRLRESVKALEGRLTVLEGVVEELRKTATAGAGRRSASENVKRKAKNPDAGEKDTAEDAAAEPGLSVAGDRSPKRAGRRRVDPEVVTEEPAVDDSDVYGNAWALVEEWRSLRAKHPHRGKSVPWLETEERLLELELAMLEEHGLTLPPETQPLRGFGRKGQTSHRWKALADTRAALKRRKLLRVFTPWLWGRLGLNWILAKLPHRSK